MLLFVGNRETHKNINFKGGKTLKQKRRSIL